jgi:hypothetical protein
MLTAKIEYGFDQLTMRSGGVLNGPSHVAMGRRAAAAIGYALGSADEGRMIEAYLTIWRLVHLPHLPAGSRGLTKEEFVRSNLALADDPAAREDTLGALADTFFELADHDRDERVNREEFWAFQHGHFPELTRADLGVAFDHLDADSDGYLSRYQFTSSIVEYWTSRDRDAPGNWWLGRPIYLRETPDGEAADVFEEEPAAPGGETGSGTEHAARRLAAGSAVEAAAPVCEAESLDAKELRAERLHDLRRARATP